MEITLSQAAKQALKAGGSDTGNSQAHQARQYIAQSLAIQSLAGASTEGADGPNLAGPFGQIVKTFAPGYNKGTADSGDAVPEDGGDVAGVTDPADGTDTPPADGSDGSTVVEGSDGTGVEGARTIIVEEPDPTELLAGEEDSGVADDSPPVDDTIVTDAPVVTADTDTLIDQLIGEVT